jgi:hypothetical protein
MGLFSKLPKRRVQESYLPPEGVVPLCPHCEQALNGVYTQEVSNQFGKTWLYFCTNCAKTLGVSQRKGFWMG